MLTRPAALALAIVVSIVGAVVGAGAPARAAEPHTSRPEAGGTYADLSTGAPTTLPWWQAGRLHLGDTVISTRLDDIVSRNGTTLVATEGVDATWYVVDGDRLRALPMQTRTAAPLISGDGRWIAWKEVRAPRTDAYKRIERYRVVLYDAVRHRIVNHFRDRRLVAWEDGINGIWLRSVSNQGRLVLHRGSDGVQVLSPHGRPVRFGGPHVGNGVEVDGWPRGTSVFRSAHDTSVFGYVRRDGDFERVGSFRVSSSGSWSADGAHYAYTDYDTYPESFRVRSLPGSTVRLDTPTDLPHLGIVGWESPSDVVLWSFDEYGDERSSHLVRCSVDDGSCEGVPNGPNPRSRATM